MQRSTSRTVFGLLMLLGIVSAGIGVQLENPELLSAQVFNQSPTTIQQSPPKADPPPAGNNSTITLNTYWDSLDATINLFTNIERLTTRDSTCTFQLRAVSEGEIVGNATTSSYAVAAPQTLKRPRTRFPQGQVYWVIKNKRTGEKTITTTRPRPICRDCKPRPGGGGGNTTITRRRQKSYNSSPPITFFPNGTIAAQTAEIFSKGNISHQQNASSTWKDTWKAYADGVETKTIQCETDSKDFLVNCSISSLPTAQSIRLEVKRTTTPFLLGGTIAPDTAVDGPVGGSMVASIDLSADEFQHTTSDICRPQLTPTPSPTVTTVPSFSPTFTPAPLPTSGGSGGDDIFQTDGL